MASAPQRAAAFQRVRQAVLLGLFAGTAVGLGFLLAGVPNVELVTLTSVLAGAALGPWGGLLTGLLAEVAFSLASPFGAALPILLAAQSVGMALAGLVGGLVAPALCDLLSCGRRLMAVILAAALGATVTIVFDLLTNLAIAVSSALDLRVVLIGGVVFALLHAGSNAVLFAVLWPLLAPRVRRLRQPSLRALFVLAVVPLLVVAAPTRAQTPATGDSLQVAPPDSMVAARADSLASGQPDSLTTGPTGAAGRDTTRTAAGPRHVRGWKRPLWDPFASSWVEDLTWQTPWLAIADGGFGSRVYLAGEPGTSFLPTILRDGLPDAVGHRFLDDVTAVAMTGTDLGATGWGQDGWGGTDGFVDRVREDPHPDYDFTDTRWHAGAQQDLFRSVHLLTASAPWRLGLDIEEHLNDEAYDFRLPGETRYSGLDAADLSGFPGRAKFRSGRGSITRDLREGESLTIAVENVRKLKNELPAFDRTEQDLWQQRVVADWRQASLRAAFYWLDTAVDWDRPATSGHPRPARKLDGGREGVLIEAGRADGGVAWRWLAERTVVDDSGAPGAWAGSDSGRVRGVSEATSASATRAWTLGPARVVTNLTARWDDGAGWDPQGTMSVAAPGTSPVWQVSLARGGRAPRSDERLTAWQFAATGLTDMTALPNRDLARERTWRAAARMQPRLAGFELALSAAWRRVDDGIGWTATSDPITGRWTNDVTLTSHTLRAGVRREGRCLGWIRVHAEAAWRGWQQDGAARIALPPRRDWQLGVLWENHFFDEDGILQIGWLTEHRGEMNDPWYLARPITLPALTQHDLLLGFRLVGTNLGVEFINLTGQRVRTSGGSLTAGRQMHWRLHWVFGF